MKLVGFEGGQQGEDWLTWRRAGIGASDISIIMGSNPYSTSLKLWEIKCGYRQEDSLNAAMKHGIAHEDIARKWLNEKLQLRLQPVCVEDPEKSHFRASLDGFDFDQQVLVEIKCPISESVLDAARTTQSVPGYWLDQVQWQIMLTNPKRAILAMWDYRTNSCITLDMFGHPQSIKKMREKADDFWHSVQIGKAPEPGPTDYIEIDDPNLMAYLEEYRDLNEKAKGIDARKKELKDQIAEFGDDGNFKSQGYKVTRMAPPITYDVKQMRYDGINIDKYKKTANSIGYYKITYPKTKGRK